MRVHRFVAEKTIEEPISARQQSAVLAETRSIPHVKDALFNYTTHEVRAFLRALRNTHGIEDGGDIPFGAPEPLAWLTHKP